MLLLGFLALTSTLRAQSTDHNYPIGKRSITVPFTYENGFLVVNVTLNRTFPLRFILDTGAEHTLLTKPEIANILGLKLGKRFTIQGSDHKRDLAAYLTRNVHMSMGDLQFPRQSLLVLEEDYFRFEEFSGVAIDGILGGNLLIRHAIRIDYRRRTVTFTRADRFEPPKARYTQLPLKFYRNKPYLEVDVELIPGEVIPVRLLLDTGAALPLMLYTETHPDLDLPPSVIRGNIGQGLGGFLTGFLGRTQEMNMDTAFQLQDLVTYFQELPPGVDTVNLYNRNGLLGNRVLRRFDVIIDYGKQHIYLRPNKYYRRPSEFDRSGLVVVGGGVSFHKYRVFAVLPDSPAAAAGLLPNDELLSVNGLPASMYSMSGIQRQLRKKVGKEVRVKVRRGSRILQMRFTLRDLI